MIPPITPGEAMGAPSRRGRWTAIAILIVLVGVGTVGGSALASHTNNDVPTGNFFHDEIGWLVDQGIANGFPDGTFKPNDPIKRQQMALWLANYNRGITIRSDSFDSLLPSSTVTVAKTCPAGTRPLGGGGLTFVADLFIRSSRPNASNGWEITWEREDNVLIASGTNFRVWAACGPDRIPA